MSQRDSIKNTITVTVLLCLVCSIAVSGAAVLLRPYQEANARLFMQKNILIAAGLVGTDDDPSSEEIDQLFSSRIKTVAVELKTGRNKTEAIDNEYDGVTNYDQIDAAGPDATSRNLPSGDETDPAGINRLENIGLVYIVMKEGTEDTVEKYVLPVRGYGLWSMMKGFLAIGSDTRTIKGLTFYEHAETPGLGGEIDNPRFKKAFEDKYAFDEDWQASIRVVKQADKDGKYEVDALSGATITSNGVTSMLQFWLGDQAYGKFLQRERERRSDVPEETEPKGQTVDEAITPDEE